MTDDGTEQEPTVAGEVVNTPDVTGDWLPPPAAADRLGMSERTLWRMVKGGRYQKRVVNRRAEILVPLPVMGATEESLGNTLAMPDRTPDTLALAILGDLKEQRQEDSAHIARLTARLTQLERENAVLRERQRSWWRRLWGREKRERVNADADESGIETEESAGFVHRP